ncbi:MAG: glycosyltransferase family 87 protein [Saprospiraceae bacterium]
MNQRVILVLFILLTAIASIQSYLLKPGRLTEGTREYSHYNNYVIFKQSFYHLTDHKDLYVLYPEEHWDLFKYSPTFALLFGIFANLPDYLGLLFWNMLNTCVLVLAVFYLPRITNLQKGLILLACLLELITSIQNEQSNGLIAGLIVFAFALCERQHFIIAAFCIILSAYIKLFGIVGVSLFIFYPQRWRLALYSILWSLILFILPYGAINFTELKILYISWFHMLQNDHSPAAYGFSVLGWLKTWFHFEPANFWTVSIGAMIFMVPFARFKMYVSHGFRLLALSSVLVWVVIFNHMAESPTFIIAMTGISIWFFSGKATLINIILISVCFLLTSLSTTDLVPHDFRNHFIQPYVLKVFPCIIIWFRIIFDMLNIKQTLALSGDTEPLSVNRG